MPDGSTIVFDILYKLHKTPPQIIVLAFQNDVMKKRVCLPFRNDNKTINISQP